MISSIAAIHVVKKSLCLDDDTYRAKLTLITGKASTKDMSEAERQKVLGVLRNEGFKPAPPARRPDGRVKLTGPYASKLQALWIAGWNLGMFRERGDAALIAFVKRQTGLDAVQFLRAAADARKAVEALKAILAREGGVDWRDQFHGEPGGLKIAWAQFRLMGLPPGDFWPIVNDLVHKQDRNRELFDREWIEVMNEFGRRIRAAKTKAVA